MCHYFGYFCVLVCLFDCLSVCGFCCFCNTLRVLFFFALVFQVKVATVKHLWEKVAAIRRTKAVGSDDLKVSTLLTCVG